MKKNGYGQYKKVSIESASKEKILLMLYEGAIKFIKIAKIGIEENDLEKKGIHIGKAFDIVVELNVTLDHKIGGELSKDLENLYGYISDKLTYANMHNDRVALDDALKIMETLYSGWKEAVNKLNN